MKKTISVLLAAVLLFSLAACGSAAQTKPASQQTQKRVAETAAPHPTEETTAQEAAVTDEMQDRFLAEDPFAHKPYTAKSNTNLQLKQDIIH